MFLLNQIKDITYLYSSFSSKSFSVYFFTAEGIFSHKEQFCCSFSLLAFPTNTQKCMECEDLFQTKYSKSYLVNKGVSEMTVFYLTE